MTKRPIRPIRSEADYEAALAEIERYFENEPRPGTPKANRFDLLAGLLEDYESKKWPIRDWLVTSGRASREGLKRTKPPRRR